jgi:hypothetical protein
MKVLGAKRVKLKIGPYWETPNLHILLTREDEVVVARCLDFTISSHGDNELAAIESLATAIQEYILSAIENDAIGQIHDPGYGKYWRMFNEAVAKDTGRKLLKSLSKSGRSISAENLRASPVEIAYA